jgi:hypothetical protein
MGEPSTHGEIETVSHSTTPIERWKALACRIELAEKDAAEKSFDYRSKAGNQQAKSWIAELRKLKASIEKARKEAKAIHLERGKAVDAAAKEFENSVLRLIEPHQKEIDAILAEEQERIDGHKKVLEQILALSENIKTSAEVNNRLLALSKINVASLEEFATIGAARVAEVTEKLGNLFDELRVREAEQAELEVLRAKVLAQETEDRAKAAAGYQSEPPAPLPTQAEPPQAAAVPPVATAAPVSMSAAPEARSQLLGELEKLVPGQLALRLVNETLHPAIVVDWSKVSVDDVNW